MPTALRCLISPGSGPPLGEEHPRNTAGVRAALPVHRVLGQQVPPSSGVQRWLPDVVRSTGLERHSLDSNPGPHFTSRW